MIDSHIHFLDKRYQDVDLDALVERAKDAGIKAIINFATHLKDFEAYQKLSKKYDIVYFGVGLHPHDAKDFIPEEIFKAEEIALNDPKCKVIGEIGLDFHYEYSSKKVQVKVFVEYLKLAQKIQFPVCLHSRAAEPELLEIIKSYQDLKMVIHSYSGPIELVEAFLGLGCYFSFNGMITFKKANNVRSSLEKVPLNRLLLETDGPYLAPTPHRGQTNESAFIKLIAEKAAEVKNVDVKELIINTVENTKKVYKL